MNPLLQALIDGAPPPLAGVGASPLAQKSQPIQKLHYTHDAMIDQIINDPSISNDRLAEMFGYTPSWISTVLCSDIFQAKLAERREQLIDPELRMSVKTQFAGLLARSMEVLRHKLNASPDKIPDQLAVQVAKMSGQALGYGNKEQKVSVTETHHHLVELGDNLVGLLRQRKTQAGRTFDVQAERTDTPGLPHGEPNQGNGSGLQLAGDQARVPAEP